ncbi:MAG: DMT family transporter [Candidatus Thorarchaeota archaeon]
MSSNAKYYAALLISMLVWGASWVAIKILTSIAQPFTIGFFRYSIASLLFLILLRKRGSSLRSLFTSKTTLSLVIGGITGIFGFMFLSLMGTRFTTAGQASIIAGINPVTVTFFAHLIHRERLTSSWRYLGIGFAFMGIVFVVGVQALLDFNISYLLGNIILIFSMLAWGIYTSAGKTAMKTLTPAEATAGSIFVGWAVFGIGSLTEVESMTPVIFTIEFWWNVSFLGALAAFFGFMMYFEAVERIGATKTGGFTSLIPVFGTTTSIIILQEPIYWTFIIGLILVVIGILILNAPDSEEVIEGIPLAPA